MSDFSAFDNALRSLESIPLARVAGRLVRLNGILLESVGCPLMTGQLCRIESANHTLIDAQAVGFNRDITYLMPFKQPVGLMAGARVFPEEKAHDILIGESWLGRVVNGLGEPLDGKGRLNGNDLLPPLPPSVNPLTRRSVDEPLDVGVKAINGLLTIGKGQRVGLMAGSGVGKSVLLGMITRQTKADIVVVGLIGERGREVKEFIDHSLGADGLAKSIVVVAPADESPLMRLKATELCHSIAAWFRDRGHHVLLLVDSLTRYAMAQREIALSLGEPPATKGYPPSAFGMIPKLVESAGNSESAGSMTAIYTVLAEGDDQQDPIVDCARAVLDGHIVLTRKLAEAGHYPAIDIGQSINRCMNQVTSLEHQQSARALKQNYAAYMEIKPLIPLGGYVAGADASVDKAVKMFPAIERFLRQEMREPASLELVRTRLPRTGAKPPANPLSLCQKGRTVTMRQIIDTLAQLQRLRDKSVKDKTVELAKQKQICAGYDNNIKALGYLVEKTSAGAAVSVESLKNVSGYKGTLRKVIAWQEQEKTLANIKATRMQKNLTAAACEEKVVALTLDDKRREQQESATAKAQKAVDDIAVQCWLRHKLAE